MTVTPTTAVREKRVPFLTPLLTPTHPHPDKTFKLPHMGYLRQMTSSRTSRQPLTPTGRSNLRQSSLQRRHASCTVRAVLVLLFWLPYECQAAGSMPLKGRAMVGVLPTQPFANESGGRSEAFHANGNISGYLGKNSSCRGVGGAADVTALSLRGKEPEA